MNDRNPIKETVMNLAVGNTVNVTGREDAVRELEQSPEFKSAYCSRNGVEMLTSGNGATLDDRGTFYRNNPDGTHTALFESEDGQIKIYVNERPGRNPYWNPQENINENATTNGVSEGNGENTNPLEQFSIKEVLSLNFLDSINFSLTNFGLYLILTSFIILALFYLSNNYDKIKSNNWSGGQESLYSTIHSIVINQINEKKGQMFFPFIFTIFVFILCCNLIGMVPYNFASTSHFIYTFSLSFTIVIGATILAFAIHQLKLFSLFVPQGCPLALLVLLVLIEFISYLARNISLGLRLAANILSGHMLLNILSGFTYKIMNSGYIYLIIGVLPLIFIIAFSGLEVGIAFIQAQVFAVLSSSYIKDGFSLH